MHLRGKGDYTCNLKDSDGQREGTLLQEEDSHFKKKMVSRTIISQCTKTGPGCLGPLDPIQTFQEPGKTRMGSSEVTASEVVYFTAASFKSGNFCSK